jgi:hypothetical protein
VKIKFMIWRSVASETVSMEGFTPEMCTVECLMYLTTDLMTK